MNDFCESDPIFLQFLHFWSNFKMFWLTSKKVPQNFIENLTFFWNFAKTVNNFGNFKKKWPKNAIKTKKSGQNGVFWGETRLQQILGFFCRLQQFSGFQKTTPYQLPPWYIYIYKLCVAMAFFKNEKNTGRCAFTAPLSHRTKIWVF